MPLLKLETNVALAEDQQNRLLSSLSKAVADALGKPEQYVMVTLARTALWMAGRGGGGAFGDLRSIGGLSPEVNRKLAKEVSKLLSDVLGIPADRVYLNFSNVEARNWGWNGSTFG